MGNKYEKSAEEIKRLIALAKATGQPIWTAGQKKREITEEELESFQNYKSPINTLDMSIISLTRSEGDESAILHIRKV